MDNLMQFVDAGESATARSTFYSTANQQQQSIANLHQEVLNQDRELYSLFQSLETFNDYNKLFIGRNLLFLTGYTSNAETGKSFVRYGKSQGEAKAYGSTQWERCWRGLEDQLIVELVWKNVPIPRLLREWATWRKERLNNSRSKRAILRFLLSDPRLEFWAMRYRPNLRKVLSHVWGDARTRRIRQAALGFLNQGILDDSKREMDPWVFRFGSEDDESRRVLCETICFIFRDYPASFQNKQFAKFVEAISDPEKLPGLPYDGAIGLRNKLHKRFPLRRILESRATQKQMSLKQKVRLQETALTAGVELRMDLTGLSLVDIIKYGYARGFDEEVRNALADRSQQYALAVPVGFDHVAVVIDTSQSMYGRGDRKFHPISVAMALALVIKRVSARCDLFFTSGSTDEFPVPQGDTDLATALLEAHKVQPSLVIVISDGYENVSAGTFESLVLALKRLGKQVPMIQLNPVLGSEVDQLGGIRRLSDNVFACATKGPETLWQICDRLAILYTSRDSRYVPALKKYLLDRLDNIKIPEAIRERFKDVESLTVLGEKMIVESISGEIRSPHT
jgi:hypothetical protein